MHLSTTKSYTTQNNHLSGGYYHIDTGEPTQRSAEAAFISRIGTPQRPILDPFSESVKIAQNIADLGQTVNVCISGGVDSECMLQSFVKSGISFRPVILKFKNDYNEFDYAHAVKACKSYGLEVFYKELDLCSFFSSSEFQELCDISQCRSPQLLVHMWLFAELNGVSVAAWNPPRIQLLNKKILTTLPSDLYFSYVRFAESTGTHIRPFFFLDNPEIFYSFLQLPCVQKIFSEPEAWSEKYDFDEYFFKCHLYRTSGFSFTDKRYKYTGFEIYKQYLKSLPNANEHEFTLRYRIPLEEKIPASKTLMSIFTRADFPIPLGCANKFLFRTDFPWLKKDEIVFRSKGT